MYDDDYNVDNPSIFTTCLKVVLAPLHNHLPTPMLIIISITSTATCAIRHIFITAHHHSSHYFVAFYVRLVE